MRGLSIPIPKLQLVHQMPALFELQILGAVWGEEG